MTDQEFITLARQIYHGHGWMVRMATDLDVRPETVGRWSRGISRPKSVDMLLEEIARHRPTIEQPRAVLNGRPVTAP